MNWLGGAGVVMGGIALAVAVKQSTAWRDTVSASVNTAMRGVIEASEAIPGARMDKLLWTARTGSPEERERARKAAQELFGFNPELNYELSVSFAFEPAHGNVRASVRYSDSVFPAELETVARSEAYSLHLQEVTESYRYPPSREAEIARVTGSFDAALLEMVKGLQCEVNGQRTVTCSFYSHREDFQHHRYNSARELAKLKRDFPRYWARENAVAHFVSAMSPSSYTEVLERKSTITVPWSVAMPPVLTVLVDVQSLEAHKMDFDGAGMEVTYWIHEKGNGAKLLSGRSVKKLGNRHFLTDAQLVKKRPLLFYGDKILWASVNLQDEYFNLKLLEEFQRRLNEADRLSGDS